MYKRSNDLNTLKLSLKKKKLYRIIQQRENFQSSVDYLPLACTLFLGSRLIMLTLVGKKNSANKTNSGLSVCRIISWEKCVCVLPSRPGVRFMGRQVRAPVRVHLFLRSWVTDPSLLSLWPSRSGLYFSSADTSSSRTYYFLLLLYNNIIIGTPAFFFQ